MTISVTINGAKRIVDTDLKLTELLQNLEIHSGPLAVEVNGEIVPRSEHVNYRLQANDIIEIVQAIGGG